jgi:CRP/FNR family cyclic AMP-dependent transcriptional regulator
LCVIVNLRKTRLSTLVVLDAGIEIMKFRRGEKAVVTDLLWKTWLWIDLSRKDLESIVKASEECKYESGDMIVKKGERGCGFYLVLDGSVEIRSDGTTLSRLGEGQFFGEMSLLDDQPRSANVVAMEPSRCLVLSSSSFKELVSCNPRIALKVCRELARRLRVTDQMLSPAVSG